MTRLSETHMLDCCKASSRMSLTKHIHQTHGLLDERQTGAPVGGSGIPDVAVLNLGAVVNPGNGPERP